MVATKEAGQGVRTMRVFVGIALKEQEKEKLFQLQNQLKQKTEKGRFTDLNNFHLTLQFIGEVSSEEVRQLKEIITTISKKIDPFDLQFDQMGQFDKNGKKIMWIGLKMQPALFQLHDLVIKEIAKQTNRLIENKSYIPHITLGRGIVLKEEAQQTKILEQSAQHFTAENITLFESTRVNGRLAYLPVLQKDLQNQL